jgi:Pterin-4a-carbinolamine dehydratase
MSKALSDKEIEKGLEKLEGWKFENNKISKSFKIRQF